MARIGIRTGGAQQTTGDMTIPVDYNDPNAVVLTPGVQWTNQDEVDRSLDGNPAKHMADVAEALPTKAVHDVEVQAAAGVFRPRVGDTTFMELDMDTIAGSFKIKGESDPDNWIEVEPGVAITGFQTDSDDPYYDFPASSFPNDGSLKGRYAHNETTGQVSVIHDHTDSRIYTNRNLSGPAVGNVVRVARPSTIFRNSQDDSATAITSGSMFTLSCNGGEMSIEDCAIEGWNNNNIQAIFNNAFRYLLTRVCFDQQTPLDLGSAVNGTQMRFQNEAGGRLDDCSIITTGRGVDQVISHIARGAFVTMRWCYLKEGEDGIEATQGAENINFWATVVENILSSGSFQNSAMRIADGAFVGLHDFLPGKRTEFRGGNEAVSAFEFETGGYVLPVNFAARIGDFGAAVMRAKRGAIVDLGAASGGGFVDIGGNTDVGWDVEGPRADIALRSSLSDLTGTNGDVRDADNEVRSYAELITASTPPSALTSVGTENFTLSDGDILLVKVDGQQQVVTFNTGDFADIANATAAEVAAVISTDLSTPSATGGTSSGSVTITSDSGGTVEVTGGSANVELDFVKTLVGGDSQLNLVSGAA